jgi:uncharacterized membrane protein
LPENRETGTVTSESPLLRCAMPVHRLLDEAIVALMSMVALWLIPNRKPPIVFLTVFAAGALFDFLLRRYLHHL